MRSNSCLLGENVYCPPLSPAEIKHQRAQRITAMWARFLRLMESEGRPIDHYLDATAEQSRTQIMRHAVRRGRPDGWYFESALEAADLGIDEPATIAKGERTPALPGTREKLAVLAERAASGLALWHAEDGKVDCD